VEVGFPNFGVGVGRGNFKMVDSQLQNAFIKDKIVGEGCSFFVQSEEYPL